MLPAVSLPTAFVITGSSKELLETEVKPLVEHFLRDRGLSLSQEKTKITHIADGFDFLGQHIRDYKGTILVKPSRKNVQMLLRKVRGVIKANAQATTGNLIGQLNPIIRLSARPLGGAIINAVS